MNETEATRGRALTEKRIVFAYEALGEIFHDQRRLADALLAEKNDVHFLLGQTGGRQVTLDRVVGRLVSAHGCDWLPRDEGKDSSAVYVSMTGPDEWVVSFWHVAYSSQTRERERGE